MLFQISLLIYCINNTFLRIRHICFSKMKFLLSFTYTAVCPKVLKQKSGLLWLNCLKRVLFVFIFFLIGGFSEYRRN